MTSGLSPSLSMVVQGAAGTSLGLLAPGDKFHQSLTLGVSAPMWDGRVRVQHSRELGALVLPSCFSRVGGRGCSKSGTGQCMEDEAGGGMMGWGHEGLPSTSSRERWCCCRVQPPVMCPWRGAVGHAVGSALGSARDPGSGQGLCPTGHPQAWHKHGTGSGTVPGA